jgi:general secretion pathway protein G
MRKNKNKLNGFTLIELLVVIGIIGILTGAVIVSLNPSARIAQARDGVRKSDLHQIQSALELYRSDKGEYPLKANFPACGSPLKNGATVYMAKIPCNPPTQASYTYQGVPNSAGTGNVSYSLTACLENVGDPDRDSPNIAPCTLPKYTSYTLQNP